MKIGARTFKTGLAVVMALLLARLLNLPSPVFAGTSAALAVQPSIYRSYLTLLEQIQGNIIGAILAIAFALTLGNDVLVIGLAAIILIVIHIQLKIDTSIPLSLSTLIVLMETPSTDFFPFSLLRFLTIMLGVLAAFIVNVSFYPPKYEKRSYTMISDITNDILKWIRVSSQKAADQQKLKETIEAIKDRLIKLDQFYLFFKEERSLSKKKQYNKLRKLVLYRQMIHTANSALKILKMHNRYDYFLQKLPKETVRQLQEKINHLIGNHEHLLLRYIEQAVQNHRLEMQEYENIRNDMLLIYKTLQGTETTAEKEPQLLQYIAAIMEYNEQLEHLEILISSAETFHKNESELRE